MTAPITDFTQFTDLRSAAGRNEPAALREVASQFEALFLQTMMENMRDASLGDPLFGNSDQMDMYHSMMDQQLAVDLASGKGIGFADMLVRQLGGGEVAELSRPAVALPVARAGSSASRNWSTPTDFAKDIWPHAKNVARNLGLAPEGIVAQAALETGWGQHVMPDRNGDSSFNLFGIKSGANWAGPDVVHATLEADGETLRPTNEKFRTYTGVAAAFADYQDLLDGNPRYESVRGTGADTTEFASALQDSGYATDPQYAEKIRNILQGPTMKQVMSDLSSGD